MTKEKFHKLDALPHRHLLGIADLSPHEINYLLDKSEIAVEVSRQVEKKKSVLRGRTHINLFFETSTRTQSSFEIAGKRLGADVMNMSVGASGSHAALKTRLRIAAFRIILLGVRHQNVSAAVVDAKLWWASGATPPSSRRSDGEATDAGESHYFGVR